MLKAWETKTLVPAFNIPYLPMMGPIVRALEHTDSFGLIQVARIEWQKFESGSLEAVRNEYERVKKERYTRLHLDHVPVVEADGRRVDFESIIAEAIALGYGSVMVDGSCLELSENIAVTALVVDMAHRAGVSVEGEVGTVPGYERDSSLSYDELFTTGQGFTDPQQAGQFVKESGVDWLGVAIGNIHGLISEVARSQKKVEARLNLEHLGRLRQSAGVPMVLHGGSGVKKEYLLQAVQGGIAKINIGNTTRQAYDSFREESIQKAQENVYRVVVKLLSEELELAGSAATLSEQSPGT